MARTPGLAALLLNEAWRKARRSLQVGPLYRWRFPGVTPERLLITPPELRRGDPQIAADIYDGTFYLAGHRLETGGNSPFQMQPPSAEFAAELNAFEWLRHLSEAGDALAAANARSLVGDWMRQSGPTRRHSQTGIDVTARRMIAWLTHSNIILGEADYALYRRFMKSMSRQMAYLRRVAPGAPDGMPRLRAYLALAFGSLCVPTTGAHIRAAARHVGEELDRQVFADGVHVSRDPSAIMEILAELLPLRQTYLDQNQPVPKGLFGAIDRMLPALRFFRHTDGSLALFNGAGVSPAQLLTALLRHDETLGDPISQAKQGGYQRLSAGNTVLIADTGRAPPPVFSSRAHAGTLAFEFSAGPQRFVVNCGAPARRESQWQRLARTTPAHSTLTLAGQSSARFAPQGFGERLFGTPLLGGPKRVTVLREDSDGGQTMTASHDGYVRQFALLHERRLFLSRDGRRIEGLDRLSHSGHGRARREAGANPAVVRFHLHPGVSVERRGDEIDLEGGGERWIFSAEGPAEIEESIFLADSAGARSSLQIVLSFDPSERLQIGWRFERRR